MELNASDFNLKANEKMVKKTGELIKDKSIERNNFTETLLIKRIVIRVGIMVKNEIR